MTYSASRDFRLTNQGLLKDHSYVLVVPDRPVTPPRTYEPLCTTLQRCRNRNNPHPKHKYVSEGSIVRDCVPQCVEKEAWSTRTYCCQQDGCNSGPSLTSSSSTYFVLAISLAVFVVCRSLRG
ncbi:PREDICTED: uncharacterized protein LOC108776613 [Cyphomyrmex costatus]|uniref:uncharacterized protein LOC108776613 n=1 Tax=Cyphomyrmex costatus TaxID=456900 RepID=UPI0008522E24|nr:PREDICTED: uncharacterized protein LOC108776613 [Cyphomyrmex costatus]